jgi:hypothetical protein
MDLFILFINTLGLTFGVGSSTYALIFFHQSIADGVIDDTEKRFLHTVYFLLRAGMALLLASYVAQGYQITRGLPIPVGHDTLALQATLLAIIFANAVLMERRLIAMWLGPAIAGAAWYGTFFAFVIDALHFSYPILMTWYVVLVIVFVLILRVVRECLMKR